jgi:type II secretory pathway pseudopilin PulG
MIELLVVIALLGVLILLSVFGVQRYITQAQDAERKKDLQTYRTVFEDYFADNGVYPPATAVQNCGSAALSPYLPKVLCDPATTTPYLYVPSPSRLEYVLFATLVNKNDPQIAQYGCENGCGPDHNNDGVGDFSIGVSNGNPISGAFMSTPTPQPSGGTPAPTPIPTPKPPAGCGSWCYANQCTTCCGAFYRCAADGLTCVPDNACDPCPNGVCTGGDDDGD